MTQTLSIADVNTAHILNVNTASTLFDSLHRYNRSMKRITVILSDELHKQLKLYAVLTDESISRIVANAVDTLLKNARSGSSDEEIPS